MANTKMKMDVPSPTAQEHISVINTADHYIDMISVIVPTFRRPDGLSIALNSLQGQSAAGLDIEIIVADNDPEGSAHDYVTQFAETSTHRVKYLHVPTPGVSNARNAALDLAQGRYLAFLDDDQDAGENWLETLFSISVNYNAALSFVPTIARIPTRSKYEPYFESFFSRFGPSLEEGIIPEFFGCGNSLLDRGLCTLPTPVFSPELNETGGEDDFLFSHLQDQGIKIAWSRAALAYEDIRPHRASPEYIKVRSFAFGQGPVQMCIEQKPHGKYSVKKVAAILRWMCIGAMQWGVFFPMALITKLCGHASYIRFRAKASEGLGKVFWFGRFKPKLYGAAVVENKAF